MPTVVKPLIAGNWKMNGLQPSLDQLRDMAAGYHGDLAARLDMAVCVPFTLLHEASKIAKRGSMTVGAQDCHAAESGAYTGDISAEMIADCGGRWVIVGHSERRSGHSESNEDIRAKAQAGQRAGLTPILCVGETLDERSAGATLEVVKRQLYGSLPDGSALAVAYEPIWAIGTGATATADDIAEVHGNLRALLKERFSGKGNSIRILYGGSVKPANAAQLLAVPHVNGALVGGASLAASDFLAIAGACP